MAIKRSNDCSKKNRIIFHRQFTTSKQAQSEKTKRRNENYLRIIYDEIIEDEP